MHKFGPAFGAIVVEAVLAQTASGWTLELFDAVDQSLARLRVTESSRDGFLAVRIATEQGFAQRQGRAAWAKLTDPGGALLIEGDVGRRGSGAWLELQTVDVEFGAPIDIAGALRW